MTSTNQIFKPKANAENHASVRASARLGDFLGTNLKTSLDEVRFIHKGLSAATYAKSLEMMRGSVREFGWIIPQRTLTHRKAKKERLTEEESGRWLRAAKVQILAEEVFGNSDKAYEWLHKNQKKFDNQSAAKMIQTEAGAKFVEDTLNQIDSGYF